MNPEEVVLLLADEYSRMAETYDANVTPHFASIAERVAELARPGPGELFLDLGTGTGLLACLVAPRVSPQAVVAIDLADGALAAGTYRAARFGIKTVRFEMMDVRNIIYPGRTFDAVVSNLGIPALGFERCFAEVARVLKPTGRFVFSEWGEFTDPPYEALLVALKRHRSPNPPKKLAELRAATEFYRGSDAVRALHDPRRVREALEAAGFQQVDIQTDRRPEIFAPPESLVDFRLSWGANEAEVAAMDPEARRGFVDEITSELRSMAGGGRLESRWVLHFYVATL